MLVVEATHESRLYRLRIIKGQCSIGIDWFRRLTNSCALFIRTVFNRNDDRFAQSFSSCRLRILINPSTRIRSLDRKFVNLINSQLLVRSFIFKLSQWRSFNVSYSNMKYASCHYTQTVLYIHLHSAVTILKLFTRATMTCIPSKLSYTQLIPSSVRCMEARMRTVKKT